MLVKVIEKINRLQEEIAHKNITIKLEKIPSFIEGLLVAAMKYVAGND